MFWLYSILFFVTLPHIISGSVLCQGFTYEVLTPHAYTHCIDVTYTYATMKSGAFLRVKAVGNLRRGLIRSCRPGPGVWVTRGKGNRWLLN